MEKSHPLSHGNDSGARNMQTYGIVSWIRSIILRQNRQQNFRKSESADRADEEENKKVKTAVMKIVMEVLPWENH